MAAEKALIRSMTDMVCLPSAKVFGFARDKLLAAKGSTSGSLEFKGICWGRTRKASDRDDSPERYLRYKILANYRRTKY